jgi:CubicO group peptidase (beta-lactamase class C family)
MTRPPSLRDALSPYVDRGVVPGAVALVARGADVEEVALGAMAEGPSAAPMRRDAIFRIASMTKPMVATAAMSLVEQGKLSLDEPVDRLLPELANRRVLRSIGAPLDDTVPSPRPITVRDLLTFRMGFGIVWGPPDGTPIQRAEAELLLGAIGPPSPQRPPAPDEWMRRFGSLPLMHAPGESWAYNTSAEVLGVLVARAASKPLGDVLEERVFGPLGMKDTGFFVPASKIDRLPVAYFAGDPFHPDTPGSRVDDPAAGGQWARPPAFPSAGAGLVSTADDVLAFGRMLLGKGALGRARVLSPASVDAMTHDHLTDGQKAVSEMKPDGWWDSHGWGYCMAVNTATDDLGRQAGSYGWDGGLGTSWGNDPARAMTAILLTQRAAFPAMSGIYRDFWKAASA